MIYGRLIDSKAIVPVIFRLSTQRDFSINFIIDTGFNDHLTLPPQAVSAMNLPLYSTTLARLADGRETLLSIHLATIVWDNREKVVPILASGFKPLLGTALMAGYHLEIDFEENGLVSLEQIPPLIS
ncbi:MAG: clan AA aspartic protease [Nostocales cyanobacterium LacPavin_0920_SED1_MAG_38_18]|nr:clan AA aspartic protease [Nostocales cyanobacterium LacPavin_0920_SED1_MAG_38_18]